MVTNQYCKMVKTYIQHIIFVTQLQKVQENYISTLLFISTVFTILTTSCQILNPAKYLEVLTFLEFYLITAIE